MINFLPLKCIVGSLLLLLISSTRIEAQNTKIIKDVYYSGGVSQFEKDFHRKMNFDINKGKYREYYLLFRIEVNKGGGIKNIISLNQKKDEVTQSIYSTLIKTSENWKNGSSKNQVVILPVFIIGEENKGNIGKPSNNAAYDYNEINGTLLKPLIIPQYKENN